MTPIPSMKLEHWPANDRHLWIAAQQPAGMFDQAGRASTWRPVTIRSVQDRYGVYLTWLESTGELDPEARPIDRIDEDRIRAFVEAYRDGRSPFTIGATLRGIAYVARATHPPDGCPWLTKIAHRLTNTADPIRPKLPRMATVDELVDLGEHLRADGLARLRAGAASGACVFRDGLMIGALVMRPIRLRNLACLQIEKTVFVEEDRVQVKISGAETKTGAPIEFSYPAGLVKPFKMYLAEVRPFLISRGGARDDDGWLWISHSGRKLDDQVICRCISNRTLCHLGRSVSPHLFRHCVATDIAIHDPAHVGIAKSVLGHATLATTQQFYNQATSFAASARHQAVVAKFRKGPNT